jgi:hypothetical protein
MARRSLRGGSGADARKEAHSVQFASLGERGRDFGTATEPGEKIVAGCLPSSEVCGRESCSKLVRGLSRKRSRPGP